MRAFLFALVALVVIAAGANQILIRSGFSSADTASPANVRVSD